MPCSGCSALHGVNPNLKKIRKTLQTIRRLLADKLSMFDHFVGLALKGLKSESKPYIILLKKII